LDQGKQVQTIVRTLRFNGQNNFGDDLTKIQRVQYGNWVVVSPKEFGAPGATLILRRMSCCRG
jgi:hypothetical protein